MRGAFLKVGLLTATALTAVAGMSFVPLHALAQSAVVSPMIPATTDPLAARLADQALAKPATPIAPAPTVTTHSTAVTTTAGTTTVVTSTPAPAAPSATAVAAAPPEPSPFLDVPRELPIDRIALKKALGDLQAHDKANLVHLPDGKPIHPGEHSPQIPAIRVALQAFGYLPDPARRSAPAQTIAASNAALAATAAINAAAQRIAATAPKPDPQFYDPDTAAALRRFQADAGLKDDGVIGGVTRKALRSMDSNRAARVEQTLAQKIFPTMHGRAIVVNVAAGLVYALDDGKVVLISRAVVGNPTHQTPLFSARITSVTLNPYWTTPDSISKAEFGGDTHIEHPGPANPLGKFRLDMPNKYEVFLHSTNVPRLFARDIRAFSHGCVRVEQVQALAKWLIGDKAWADAGADTVLAGWKYKQIKLAAAVPVYLAYWTASIGTTGAIVYHADPYNMLAPPAPPAAPMLAVMQTPAATAPAGRGPVAAPSPAPGAARPAPISAPAPVKPTKKPVTTAARTVPAGFDPLRPLPRIARD